MAGANPKSLPQIFFENLSQQWDEEVLDYALDQATVPLGIVCRAGLAGALGPIGSLIPVENVAKFMIKIGYTSFKKFYAQKTPVGSTYAVRRRKSGIIVAENTSPVNLNRIPVPLPRHVEFVLPSRRLLRRPSPLLPLVRQIDGNRVFSQLRNTNPRVACSTCGRSITKIGSMEIGHDSTCPQFSLAARSNSAQPNSSILSRIQRRKSQLPSSQRSPSSRPLRQVKCVLCGRQLTYQSGISSGHADDCLLNPLLLRPQAYNSDLTRFWKGNSGRPDLDARVRQEIEEEDWDDDDDFDDWDDEDWDDDDWDDDDI